MPVKTLIVDDEAPARRRLRKLLQDVPEIEIVGEAENGQSAIREIDRTSPDLVLLDVQMPVRNGFEVLERTKHLPQVIFITAWDQYAIRAFEVNAADYLLKPYSRERLIRAIEKAVRAIHESVDGRARIISVLENYRESSRNVSRIAARRGTEIHMVEIDDICYFTADDGLVFLSTAHGRYFVDDSLQSLEESLDRSRFLRVHRKSIVNLGQVAQVTPAGNGRFVVTMKDGTTLAASRERVRDLKRAMGVRGTPRSGTPRSGTPRRGHHDV